MRTFLGGINGVGKTTVLQLVKSKLPQARIVHGSKEYMRFLGISPNGYDQLRSLPESEHKIMLRRFMKTLLKQTTNDQTLIFDGHFVVFDQSESPIIKVADWIRYFDLMILLEAETGAIYERVAHDQKLGIRHRSYNLDDNKRATATIIQQRLNYTHIVARRISEWFGVPLVVIQNNSAHSAAQEILSKVTE